MFLVLIKKVACTSCGFEFPTNFVRIYCNEPYCDFCYFDKLSYRSQKGSELYLPSFYLSRKHHEYFMILFDEENNEVNNWGKLISAYILSIPSIYESSLIQNMMSKLSEVFSSILFCWQFDFIIFQFNEATIDDKVIPYSLCYKFRLDTNGNPIQNRIVKSLPLGCQVVLEIVYFLQFNVFSKNEILKLVKHDCSKLDTDYKNMIEEIFRFSQKVRVNSVKDL